jgi:ketosteroid isomerase-like protein
VEEAEMTVDEWVEAYGRAWRDKDADAVVELFTEEAEYRSSPFREPHVRADGIRTYWKSATSTQESAVVRMGRPFLAGDLVVVEWWTTMVDDGEQVTLPGCLLLRFAEDGRCRTLREYWNVEEGVREPHPGWGE